MPGDSPIDDKPVEDNSLATKIGVITGLVLLGVVFAGCAWVLWQIVKIIYYLFS
jgi:hypothetical protein